MKNPKENKLFKSFWIDKIHESWNFFFFDIFGKDNLVNLLEKIDLEWENYNCYPEKSNIFRLFREISLDKIKIVILGQDPYHQPGIADGIAFSTNKQNFIPRSLENIFIELSKDLNCRNYERKNSSLINWVNQGVFLINSSLSVQEGKQLSHFLIWKEFVDKLLKYISSYNKNIIWVLWGRKAKNIKLICEIDNKFIIESAHPSPFSANLGFFGSRPFSKANQKLREIKKEEINWLE